MVIIIERYKSGKKCVMQRIYSRVATKCNYSNDEAHEIAGPK